MYAAAYRSLQPRMQCPCCALTDTARRFQLARSAAWMRMLRFTYDCALTPTACMRAAVSWQLDDKGHNFERACRPAGVYMIPLQTETVCDLTPCFALKSAHAL